MKLIRKTVIRDISQKEVYLTRWSIWLPFGYGLKLHCIHRPDSDRCHHDHPWPFWTMILWGGYDELTGDPQTLNKMRPGMIRYRPADFRHRIVSLPRKKAWTLVLTCGRTREWGFYTLSGWMPWQKFIQAAQSARVLWCHDGTERKDS